jgi:predicted ABC-type transport system involved in lysophospholipase L1 biosynthesis ATPase subunit
LADHCAVGLLTRRALTLVVTTHNLALGYRSDRVLILQDGRIVKEEPGRPAPATR